MGDRSNYIPAKDCDAIKPDVRKTVCDSLMLYVNNYEQVTCWKYGDRAEYRNYAHIFVKNMNDCAFFKRDGKCCLANYMKVGVLASQEHEHQERARNGLIKWRQENERKEREERERQERERERKEREERERKEREHREWLASEEGQQWQAEEKRKQEEQERLKAEERERQEKADTFLNVLTIALPIIALIPWWVAFLMHMHFLEGFQTVHMIVGTVLFLGAFALLHFAEWSGCFIVLIKVLSILVILIFGGTNIIALGTNGIPAAFAGFCIVSIVATIIASIMGFVRPLRDVI